MTYNSQNISEIFAGGNPAQQELVKVATGETIYPGYAIYIAQGQAYAAKSSDSRISGFAALKEGHDIDTAYDEGDFIPWYIVGQDTYLWLKIAIQSPAQAIDSGDLAILSTTDGQLAYNDGTTLSKMRCGKFMGPYYAGSASVAWIMKVNIGAT